MVLRPRDRDRGVLVHAGRLADRRGVMIPEDGDGALLDMRHHGVDHPSRVGPVAHIVAEEDILVGPAAPSMFEAGLEGLAIGVDVADERYSHGFV